ncbi:hypothetical protein IscW_ISCW003362 [Ixodes scapularis]|uniref:Uncharacterized protein n=1 Tax=Ixodes scapularis TaxID=6945 RepID=B7P9N1_IXOSC|nr:hypothetical protein IscW_ISCW003362 [Ixodes scapularis]|eukprot:XP_002404879.1 hypothetical protein IscW_ISCW003362 [Ixodes scapularis]
MNDQKILSLLDRFTRPCQRSTRVAPDAVNQQLYLADSVWYPFLNCNSAASGDVLFWTLLEVLLAEFTDAILNCVMGGKQPQPRLHTAVQLESSLASMIGLTGSGVDNTLFPRR